MKSQRTALQREGADEADALVNTAVTSEDPVSPFGPARPNAR
jgi:hypothetical protein